MRCLAVAFSLLAEPVLAQETQIEKVQDRDTGSLVMAISGAEFSVSLLASGRDIVGFNHPAANDDDRAKVAVAISDLSEPLELFVVPAEAGCFTASANVTLAGESLGQQDDESEPPDAHTEFQADYLVQCQDIAAINNMRFAYFERFEHAQALDVQIRQQDGTQRFDVLRADPELDLPGLF